MLANPRVRAILVNIFGGIMRCDVIAEGVTAAAREIGLGVPLVVRLEGTNVEEGKRILAESGLEIESASGMDEAARKAVGAVRGEIRFGGCFSGFGSVGRYLAGVDRSGRGFNPRPAQGWGAQSLTGSRLGGQPPLAQERQDDNNFYCDFFSLAGEKNG